MTSRSSMRAITLWQPYATAIALGHKHYETRSWRTSWYGQIAIHASKKKTGELSTYLDSIAFKFPKEFGYLKYDKLPFGCVIAIGRLIYCHRTEIIRDTLTDLERSLGDYSDGRFAWELEIVKLPDAPIPAKGNQGIWEWYHNGQA